MISKGRRSQQGMATPMVIITSGRLIGSYLAGILMLLVATVSPPVYADVDGKAEFEGRCAVCHGTRGFGDGPLTRHFSIKMPDLTLLSHSNNNVFPEERVRKIIDGR